MSGTTSATPSATSSGASNRGTFLGSSGSTIVLAFLAVSLFAGGLLVMFATRRYVVRRRRVPAWDSTDPPYTSEETELPRGFSLQMLQRVDVFGKVPQLCDVSAAISGLKGWDRTMPLAARLVNADGSPSGHDAAASGHNVPASASTSSAPLHPFRVGWRDTRAQFASLGGSRPPHRSDVDAPSPAESAPISVEPLTACVEVALAIVLPTRTPCEAGQVPFFALGLTNVRWTSGSLEGASHVSPHASLDTS